MSLFRYGSPCFWKQSLPVDCPCWWRWMARDQIISAFPVLGLQACGTVLANFHGFWAWNSCPHICMASPSDLVNSTVLKYSLLLITNLLIFIFNQLTGHQSSFFFKNKHCFCFSPLFFAIYFPCALLSYLQPPWHFYVIVTFSSSIFFQHILFSSPVPRYTLLWIYAHSFDICLVSYDLPFWTILQFWDKWPITVLFSKHLKIIEIGSRQIAQAGLEITLA